MGQGSAAACVELWCVFENANRCLYGIDTATPSREYVLACM
jgi:hypothetical protein